jgi:MIP family channel proteins
LRKDYALTDQFFAEMAGTYVLVFFGVGAVHTAVLTGAQSGLWQVAIVWGIAIALAIYAIGAISRAHMNPAITVVFATFGRFPIRKVPWYFLAQLMGAFLAAATLYALFHGIIAQYELGKGIVRGMPGSELSGMIYGEYFPNPSLALAKSLPLPVSMAQAIFAEGIGTAFLAFFVFAVTDEQNPGRPSGTLLGVFIGLAVSIIISIIAPLTQAGLNPARDFGPRLFAFLSGWGRIAIPGPRGGFFSVYIVAPIVGAVPGAGVYQFIFQRMHLFERDTARIPEKGLPTMKKRKLILVGGFLGTGKTTLLWQAAQQLTRQGHRVALITNDQAPGLVDTGILKQAGWTVGEIAGGCFCCKFDDLVETANGLIKAANPDIIIGEPVGSCTDLSATVLQPFKDTLADQFDLAPFTVLIDPNRLRDAMDQHPLNPLHSSARYILRKQLEEADIIVLNKADQIPASDFQKLQDELRNQFPNTPLLSMSALHGQGIPKWLESAQQRTPVGQKIADVDYDTYAEGEAVLGWLNATASLSPKEAIDWGAWGLRFLEGLQRSFSSKSAEIAHMKMLMVSASNQSLSANLTSSRGKATLRGQIYGDSPMTLVFNARVQMPPEELHALIEEHLKAVCGETIQLQITAIQSLSPGRPQPVHRYATVI